MNKTLINAIVSCLSLLVLVSCTLKLVQPSSSLPTYPTPTHPQPMTIATLRAYPSPVSIENFPDQVTDGKLLFSVEKIGSECHKAGDSIKYKITYTNLTTTELTLLNYFHIAVNRSGAGGNIAPFITTHDNQDILTTADFGAIDFFPSFPKDFYKLMPNNSYTVILEQKFPNEIVLSASKNKLNKATPAPGQYYVRFLYNNAEKGDSAWVGEIASNRISICIVK